MSLKKTNTADLENTICNCLDPYSLNQGPIKIFAHLAHNKDAENWREAWTKGSLVGLNDITPYGYGRANTMGCHVRFSRSRRETILGRLVRLTIRVILGFDMIHAIHQRNEIFCSDVIWTHTESQFLAVSALLMTRRSGPKLIGQSVWLFDRWAQLGPIRRTFYRFLIRRVDVLTTLSTNNSEIARKLFPGKRVEMLHFGLKVDELKKPDGHARPQVSIAAVGNDRHRDWETLIAAVNDLTSIKVDILSRTAFRHRRSAKVHIRIRSAETNDELRDVYNRSTVAVVPLLKNDHASGITAILEAILAGVPVVTSDTGGLRAYFTNDEVVFVPVGDVDALRAAIVNVIEHRTTSLVMAEKAQTKVLDGPANLDVYIRRHVEISRELVCTTPQRPTIKLTH